LVFAQVSSMKTRRDGSSAGFVSIAAFADAEKARLAAGRHLARRQPEPRRHIPSAPEDPGVVDRGHRRRGVDRPNPRNGRQASRRFVLPRQLGKLFVKGRNTFVERTPFGSLAFDQIPDARLALRSHLHPQTSKAVLPVCAVPAVPRSHAPAAARAND
jgi:hypothetical protein